MTARENIITEINKIDVAKLTSDLVKIRSYSFMDNQEQEVAEFIRDFLVSNGVDARLQEVATGRSNVIARVGGGNGPVLMLNGHIDTVPAYDMENAFSGEIRDGKVYGRGTSDMKGSVAAMMAALVGIKNARVKLKGDLVFAAVADEEEAGIGTKALLMDWCGADAVIVGEPSELKIGLGNKGLEWIKVEFYGKKVHGGNQEDGINAIEMAARFITYLTDEYSLQLAERKIDYLGSPTINIGTVFGGDQPSTVADKCLVTFDRRSIPGETVEDVYLEINEIIEILAGRHHGFSAKASDLLDGRNEIPHLGFCTNSDAGIVKAVQAAADAEGMGERPLVGLSVWTDAGFISNNTDAECIIFGPGEMAVCHTADEYVSIEQLKKAAVMFALTALEYCGESE
ncbi:MAG: M20 family metallopeptidase [Eubacteriales bacterium]|nr:M20 family metallopeptidase [Eubacteriales bacterium]